MKILIIEDDESKIKQLSKFLDENIVDCDYQHKMSFQSGIRELLKNNYDLILLDMTMPMYDKSEYEHGGNTEAFAGEKILNEMRRRRIKVKTIVVTMFESFGENSVFTLNELTEKLKKKFADTFIDSVYYNASENKWSQELKKLLQDNFKNIEWHV